MAGSNLRKFKRPEVIREFTFSLFIKFITRFKPYLDLVGFSFEDSTEETFDYDGFVDVLLNKFFVGDNEEFFNAFALLGATSTPSFDELLRSFIQQQEYRAELTDTMSCADMALLIYTHDPEELSNIEKDSTAAKKKSFGMYAARRDTSEIVLNRDILDELERLMNMVFRENNCGETALARLGKEENGKSVIIMRHGDTYKRQGIVHSGKKSKTIGFQPESHNKIVLNCEAGELQVCVPSSPKWLEPAYCQNLGMALFHDPDAFTLPRINDLEVIKELKRSITQYRGHGITDIILREVKGFATASSQRIITHSTAGDDLFLDFERDNYDLSEMGKITNLKFLVKKGKLSRTVSLDASNRSGYDYDDFGLSVDAWLRAVHVIRSLKQEEEASYVAYSDDDVPIAAAI